MVAALVRKARAFEEGLLSLSICLVVTVTYVCTLYSVNLAKV